MSTLANAVDVLKLIARLRRDITVTDAVAELGMPKSSASRTLSMMAEYGFLERDAVTRAYRPGAVIMEASFHFRTTTSVTSLLEEALESLVADTGYTGYISVLDGRDAMVVQMRTGKQLLQVYTPPGSRGAATANSMGRALLARMSDQEVVALVGRKLPDHPGHAPRTVTDLLGRLARTRSLGWSESRGENVPHVAGVSAAVVDPGSGQAYGIGIAVPEQDVSDALLARFAVRVRDAACYVGKRIGDAYWLAFAAA
ncbi:MAG: IclR family transcriptional regulator [Burkholderiales bacterium]|nr:IclR family transcriptional regulator [Burkholderiales bacterium]